MQKICTSLSGKYEALIVNVPREKNTNLLQNTPYKQKRIDALFKSGFLRFVEGNIRSFLFLLFRRFDLVCAIDIDTIIPAYLLSVIKRKKRVLDAHEIFSEAYTVLLLRKRIRPFWIWLEKNFMPRFPVGYTVKNSLKEIFFKMYGVHYDVILNTPVLENKTGEIQQKDKKLVIYQGVVQYGRGMEYLIPAMKNIDAKLIICGKGNFYIGAQALVKEMGLCDKIEFKGNVLPDRLKIYTEQACIGINLLENKGQSFYLSLANKTFEYMHALIPQVTMNFPEYTAINNEYEIAVLIDELNVENIVNAINRLLNDDALYNRLQQNCEQARLKYNWQNEEKKLIAFYDKLFKD
jgi:glycosyltransferase involved in cell wall biosynthesis